MNKQIQYDFIMKNISIKERSILSLNHLILILILKKQNKLYIKFK